MHSSVKANFGVEELTPFEFEIEFWSRGTHFIRAPNRISESKSSLHSSGIVNVGKSIQKQETKNAPRDDAWADREWGHC